MNETKEPNKIIKAIVNNKSHHGWEREWYTMTGREKRTNVKAKIISTPGALSYYRNREGRIID